MMAVNVASAGSVGVMDTYEQPRGIAHRYSTPVGVKGQHGLDRQAPATPARQPVCTLSCRQRRASQRKKPCQGILTNDHPAPPGRTVASRITRVRTRAGQFPKTSSPPRAYEMTPNGRITLVRALVQRRGGELIQAIPRAQGNNGLGLRPALERSEIPRSTANLWESLLRLEEAQIRGLVATRTEAKQPIRLSYLYGLARIRRREAMCSSRINRSTRARHSARRRNLKRSSFVTFRPRAKGFPVNWTAFPFPRSSPRRSTRAECDGDSNHTQRRV